MICQKKCPTPLLFVRRNIRIPGNAKFVDLYTISNIFFTNKHNGIINLIYRNNNKLSWRPDFLFHPYILVLVKHSLKIRVCEFDEELRIYFYLTHSDNASSATLSVVIHFLTYSWTDFVLHFKSVVPIAVVSWIYVHKRLCYGDYHGWLHLDRQLWYVQKGYILQENGNSQIA